MEAKGKKFIALFLVFSLTSINCITIRAPELKRGPGISPERKYVIISPSKAETIKPGTRVVVILKSGDRVSGKFSGLILVPSKAYAESYGKSREQLQEEIMLPALGEIVTIIPKLEEQYECVFLGFGYGIMLQQIGRIKRKADISKIKMIVDSGGGIIEIETLRNLISEGKIPVLSSGIAIQNKAGMTQIALEDVYQIKLRIKKQSKLGWILPVLVATAVFVMGAIEQTKKMECFTIAAYNSPLHPYVRILRDFRDSYLMPSKVGRKLVDSYYKYSPFVADLIVKHKILKVVTRINLLPLVASSYSMVHFGPITTTVLIAVIFILPVFLILLLRRKQPRLSINC